METLDVHLSMDHRPSGLGDSINRRLMMWGRIFMVCVYEKGDKLKSIFRDKWNVFCLLFYKLILMDRIRYNLFSLKLGELTPWCRDKWKVIEYIFCLLFYNLILMDRIRYNLFSLKLGELTPESSDKWKVIEYIFCLLFYSIAHLVLCLSVFSFAHYFDKWSIGSRDKWKVFESRSRRPLSREQLKKPPLRGLEASLVFLILFRNEWEKKTC